MKTKYVNKLTELSSRYHIKTNNSKDYSQPKTHDGHEYHFSNVYEKKYAQRLYIIKKVAKAICTFGIAFTQKNYRKKWGKIVRRETTDVKVYVKDTSRPSSATSKKTISITAEEKEVNEAKEIFKQGLIHQDTQPAQTDINLNVDLTEEQKRDLTKAFKEKYDRIDKDSVPYIRKAGGEHLIFILKSLPDVIFKIPMHDRSEIAIDRELATYENASVVIGDQGLNLLTIPRCCKYSLNGMFFLCQERMDIDKSYHSQKGLYEFAFEDPDLRPIVEKALLQFVRFICLTGFKDVKYNNFPLLLDGRGIGLFDLDQSDGVGGLVGGGGPKQGAFIVAPDQEALEKLESEAHTTLLNEGRLGEFLEIWPANKDEIERSIQKKQQKRKAVQEFLERSHRRIGTEIPLSKKYSPKQQFFVNEINRNLKKSRCFDLVMARQVRFPLHKMWTKNKEIGSHYDGAYAFYTDTTKVLSDLQKQGAIHSFKVDTQYWAVSIFC